MNSKELESVTKLNGSERYNYAIKKIADWEEVWGLYNNGWTLVSDGENECFPIWPHAEYAATCATNEWEGNEPKAIELEVWMKKWLPGLEEDQKMIAVFPTPNNKGVVVSVARLQEDLNDEIALYE